ncbi:PLC-like phosphodiesterase [Cantharellus anzutake]|uniref:PLC-like phosphodiesterase n=1 Tax=Cantharellus anzutake TaxID=1750568 RepID=UPI00190316F5|nr:PLC-like phosphodiesterase [Cantharellus anzutake]KAF8335042.1 PLC-like phosphodiesterase [Cantharellus anzutake]
MVVSSLTLPECWGHRGASAAFPENTLASFSAAIRDGAEGIESDVHVSKDNVVIMFHDPSLDRTTNVKGLIRDKDWFGDMEHARTIKKGLDGHPQPIPTFKDTVELIMKEGNNHVKFNVDVKVQNDPGHLFVLMREIICAQPNWETQLAPRIVLGLWHPKFIGPARRCLPFLRLAHIGMSTHIAREYFWETCETFSMSFSSLLGWEGEKFREDCAKDGKKVMVWTVNRREEMIEVARWGASVVLTDVTSDWLALRAELQRDYGKTFFSASRLFLWTRPNYYRIMQFIASSSELSRLERIGGPFEKVLASVQIA